MWGYTVVVERFNRGFISDCLINNLVWDFIMSEPEENSGSKPPKDSKKKIDPLELREDRKSKVRVRVTYIAATFLFGGGTLFILYLIFKDMNREALTLFNTLIPIASGFVAFWFAGRGSGVKSSKDQE